VASAPLSKVTTTCPASDFAVDELEQWTCIKLVRSAAAKA
jgi:hypothetical protein